MLKLPKTSRLWLQELTDLPKSLNANARKSTKHKRNITLPPKKYYESFAQGFQ